MADLIRLCAQCRKPFQLRYSTQTNPCCSLACGSHYRRRKVLPKKPCLVCGVKFNPKTQFHAYCSPRCSRHRANQLSGERKKREVPRLNAWGFCRDAEERKRQEQRFDFRGMDIDPAAPR